MIDLPHTFRQNIVSIYQEQGRDWLHALPHTLAQCQQKWQLDFGQVYSNLSFHYVLSCQNKNSEALVLKLGVPGDEFNQGCDALLALPQASMVELIEYDKDIGAILMRQLRPGVPLSTIDEQKATLIAANLFKASFITPPKNHNYPHINDWLKGLDNLLALEQDTPTLFPLAQVEEVINLRDDLVSSMTDEVLIHGDLHHENILSHTNTWRIIDPKGVIAEKEYEIGAFMQNPHQRIANAPNIQTILHQRIDHFHKALGYSKERMMAWSIVQSCLSAWWAYECNNEDYQAYQKRAQRIYQTFKPGK